MKWQGLQTLPFRYVSVTTVRTVQGIGLPGMDSTQND